MAKLNDKPKLKVTMGGAEMFPTRYAGGSDLHGKSFTLEIAGVQMEEMNDPHTFEKIQKYVIYFRGAQRGMVLGKQFAESIAEATGETDAQQWTGKRVEIYPQNTRLGVGVRARKAPNGPSQVPDVLQEDEE